VGEGSLESMANDCGCGSRIILDAEIGGMLDLKK